MSGHSKWATTKHKKALIDAKRSKIFTKAAKLITIAARDGKSGDPVMNPGLRLAIDNAKAVSMPRENIDRAIKRGLGGLDGGAQLENITYEAYAPGGVAILIECLTDNKNRALSEVKTVLTKNGGSFASAGSVSYLFRKVGQIIVDEAENSVTDEELELIIFDSGALDFEKDETLFIVTCEMTQLNQVKTKLESDGVKINSAEIIESPTVMVDIPDDKKEKIGNLLELLDDLDDVNNVYSNANL
ncbi:YebC/PmpR family DNA-binding transcriptional regulator [Candidatus Berkelbacteria bacterium CG10_big_fil_rev_8_21_14_0_10_43_13]|uniref:Probable transcriptional regulatory protein COT78_02295 n=1 Tax=Candidatus Berkelbacteria bacterium CG10_big_fil_rev_8_21_14_0_10_43_13 TaxID=1974514 RepID=A0A2H0W6G5_9BACT|nr:MAG: YebC/PmpR family DNA-binding transcriptional regulator [Candidatus Berkelbacteria bacterium CG10_big_fil_rev_8_21_14_0_10_43_13]